VLPGVSIVIPNYNGAKFLHDAITSALKQDYENKEVIVVDDGSTDSSVEKLREFGSKIVLIQSKNNGASTARNIGISAAKFELIAFLDSDDIWATNKLSTQIDCMQLHDLDLVYCNGQEFGETPGLNLLHEAIFEGDCYKYFKKFPGKAIIDMGPSTAIIKKSLLNVTGVFDTSFTGPAEDWDFFRRYCKLAKVGFCNEVLVYRRIHSNNESERSLIEYYLGNKRAIQKMITEDPSIDFFERVIIWAKFKYICFKSFLKVLISPSQ